MLKVPNPNCESGLNLNNKRYEGLLLPSSFEYDTEYLFFPSRIVKKKELNKRSNTTNDDDSDGYGGDNDEYIAIRKLLLREISVHLNVSKQNHPNIVSMLESFQYNISGCGSSKDSIITMAIEY